MRITRKVVGLFMVIILLIGLLGRLQIKAEKITIGKPKITLKSIKNGTGIKVKISKTRDADAYAISWEYGGNPYAKELYELYGWTNGLGPYQYGYADRKQVSYTGFYYDDYSNDSKVENPYILEKNGKATRSVIFNNLQPGTYKFKVRAWNDKKYGARIYSEYSIEKSITLNGIKNTTGYKTSYDFSKVKKGDVIKFGTYEQDKNYTNGREPIEWIVLSKTKKKVLIISKYALDSLYYDTGSKKVTWEECTLRKWLNSVFVENAFNKTEQGMIRESTVRNFDNVICGSAGGNPTKDKVFLLSQLDTIDTNLGFSESYYDTDIKRTCAFAWDKGKCPTYSNLFTTEADELAREWWLRSPGEGWNIACYVGRDGRVSSTGLIVYGDRAVRPVLYIDLKS